ncbi:ABC multidrug transporter, putative [Metarhizium acridum CQMa 102]|uniref:ABC multidrug transporter, putative n=1 Tax=Metarhizium acridum (strain CQMa 102) TaxID=655827 RepID=E9E2C0_METAQ|nr:ABC multidrug transporter, putative [Metarhizium acridum CQMa 102]EFY90036.1 ABC multidrug transporter, putative [Metarhizium acridum CQMa 102]
MAVRRVFPSNCGLLHGRIGDKSRTAHLRTSDLWDTDEELRSRTLERKLVLAWQSGERGNLHRHRLLFSVFKALKWPLLLTILPRIALIGFKFAQPYLMKRVILFVQDASSEGERQGHMPGVAWALVLATGLTFVGSALSTGFYQHQLFRTITMIRGALISVISVQSLTLTGTTTQSSGPAVLTLTGPDVNAICASFHVFHELWANPIEIGFAIYLLERELGPGCIGPAVSVIVCTLAMSQLSKYIGPAMKAWNNAIQNRVSTTSKVIRSIKEVKMLGMSNKWLADIQVLRVIELKSSKSFRLFITYMNVLGNTPSALAPILTFGIAIAVSKSGTNQRLSIATVFTARSIMGLIIAPLSRLLSEMPSFLSSLGCFERIQEFLEATHDADGNMVSVGEGHDVIPSADSTNIELAEQCSLYEPGRSISLADGASFAPKQGDAPILYEITLNVEPASLTIVTGKVGSGKSMLLLGLLGELHATGFVSRHISGAGYCSQSAWLTHGSIKENIVGPNTDEIDELWYRTAVRACALDKDFAQMPNGDQSSIGSNGITLSGGQRHRVSLARALYSRKRIVFVDDILSSLDAETRAYVWTHVFGSSGLAKQGKVTVILATHDYKIVMLDNGRVKAQGTYHQLIDNGQLTKTTDARSSNVKGADGDDYKSAATDGLASVADENEMEDLMRKSGDPALYIYYFRSIGWALGITGLAIGILQQFFQVFPQIWLKWWGEANSSGSHVDTGKYFGVYAFFLAMCPVLIGFECWTTGMYWRRNTYPHGRQTFYLRTSRQLRLLDLQAKAPIIKQLLETIQGLPTIRAFKWRTIMQDSILDLLDRSQRPHYLLYSIQRWLTLVLDLFVAASAVILVALAVFTGASSAGSIGLAMLNVIGFNSGLADLISSWTSLETSLGAIARLRAFEMTTPLETVNDDATGRRPAKPWPPNGQVELRNVTASYSTAQQGPPVLEDISLRFHAGEKVAICGKTGSGKSTLVSTLFRLLDYSGTIEVDGTDITAMPREVLRSQLIAVPQEPVLFEGSLRSNFVTEPEDGRLRGGEEVLDEYTISVLDKLELWAAISLHGGLDTDIEDLSLSHGQKQLVCLARAILRKHVGRIVILDEAMSSVDAHTAQVMVRALEDEFKEHTVFSVVHRLDTIRDFDTIVVLDRGRVVRTGPPHELLTSDSQLRI